MKIAGIQSGWTYDVVFDGWQSAASVKAVEALPEESVMLIGDEFTSSFFPKANDLFQAAGKTVAARCILPRGESFKNLDSVMRICRCAAENHLGRDSVFAAVGGGVIGDMAGFAAAIYMRGVPFVQMPTTLLAMVDASVGGKTGVDAPWGKNAIGAFHQPSLVLADTSVLASLPDNELRCGWAELIKCAMIDDGRFGLRNCLLKAVDRLEFQQNDPEFLAGMIRAAVELKAYFVHCDEFDTGIRQFLNYGHTVAHALEKASGYSIPHGEAVSLGMDAASFIALFFCQANHEFVKIQDGLLGIFCPPKWSLLECLDISDILAALRADKKNRNGKLNFVLPDSEGHLTATAIDSNDENLAAVLSAWLAVRIPSTGANQRPGLVLGGIKGAGKSTLGAFLGERLNMPFIDSDEIIQILYQNNTGRHEPCREIYRQLGEDGFRKLEAQAVDSIASHSRPACIALGGGTLANPYLNHESLAALGRLLIVRVPYEVAFKRIQKNGLPPFLENTPDPFEAFVARARKVLP